LALIKNQQATKRSEHQIGIFQYGGVGGILAIENVVLGLAS
jgi:hypothetical protein